MNNMNNSFVPMNMIPFIDSMRGSTSNKPIPGGAIEVTLEQVREMFEALYEEENYIFEYNQDYVCHCSGEEMADMWESFDEELVNNCFEDVKNAPWFSVNGLEIYSLHENAIGSDEEKNAIGSDEEMFVYFGSLTAERFYFRLYSVEITIDAETGDTRILSQGWPTKTQITFKFNRHK